MKYWQKLLVAWRNIGRTGLTIPFLIGSQNYLKSSEEKQSIEDLIYDISICENEIYLTYCPHIKELILACKDENRGNFKGEFVHSKFDKQKKSKLYVSKIIIDNLKQLSLEELVEHLKDKHDYHIENNLFSKVGDHWTDYTENDIKLIKEHC